MGKTTSINLAAIKFIQEATRLGYTPVIGGEYNSDNDISNHLGNNSAIIVTIPKYVIIVFAPAGDDGSSVQNNIQLTLDVKGDILVTASRTKGKSADVICRHGQENPQDEIFWIAPVMNKWTPVGPLHDPETFYALKKLTATHILEVLKYIISHIRSNCLLNN